MASSTLAMIKSSKKMSPGQVDSAVQEAKKMAPELNGGGFDNVADHVSKMIDMAGKSDNGEDSDYENDPDKKMIDDAVKSGDLHLMLGDEVISDPKQILDLVMNNQECFSGEEGEKSGNQGDEEGSTQGKPTEESQGRSDEGDHEYR